jgi:hypothetical protein
MQHSSMPFPRFRSRPAIIAIGVSAPVLLLMVAGAACRETPASPGAEPALILVGGAEAFGLQLGVRWRITAAVRNAAGDTVAAGPTLVLGARDPAVVAVDTGGTVVARGVGETWLDGRLVVSGRELRDSVRVLVTCTSEGPSARLRLDERTVAVGQTLTPTVTFTYCSGQLPYADEPVWSARDPLILAVDSATGRTTGRAPGTTDLIVRGRRGGGGAWVPITVVR